jgi:hypothetical protein
MSEPAEESPAFALDDVIDHVETYGVDLFPPLDLSRETTRAQAFFAEVRDLWPHLYESVTMGGAEFKISAPFEFRGKKKASTDTLVVNTRGPIFTFPHRMALFGEDVDLRGADPAQVFEQCLNLFLQTFPGRQLLRVAVVRYVTFGTGQTNCLPWLGKGVLQFDTERLAAASCMLMYQDETYNMSIQMQPIQQMAFTPVPALGQMMGQAGQFGLQVAFNVNNNVSPLSPEALQALLARARALWPRGLLHFLNQRRLP